MTDRRGERERGRGTSADNGISVDEPPADLTLVAAVASSITLLLGLC
jgi:hypothetical protein